jgi:hypothetical protein
MPVLVRYPISGSFLLIVSAGCLPMRAIYPLQGKCLVMSVVTNPATVQWFPPTRVPFAAAAVLALLFLGMSLTAVAEMKVDRENDYLTGDGQILTADDNHTPLGGGTAAILAYCSGRPISAAGVDDAADVEQIWVAAD